MTTKYNVYAEDMDGKRRFIAQAIADRGGNGLFDLYADECGDEEQIVIVPVAVTDAARALGSMTSPAKQASSRANGKRGGRPRITKYFSVGVGSSTDMERHPAPDFTCGHKHKSIEAAEECQRKLMAINPQTRQCSAKWYNSYIVGSSSTANSGWRGINDEKLYTD